MRSIDGWQKRIFKLNRKKGWHPDGAGRWSRMPTFLANLHGEVSEAWECWRRGEDETHIVDGKPEGLPSELADIAIRLLDTCEALGIDLEAEMERKFAYNITRPRRHGGKRA